MTTRPRLAARALAAALATTMLLSGCIASGRTSHPDNKAGSVACPVDPDPSITTKVRIAWQAIPNGDLVIKDLRLLETCMPNAQISWVKMNSGADVIQGFGSDSIDLAQVGSSPAVKAASPPLNKDVQVVWISDVIGDAESLIAKDPAVKELADLTGKTIAVPFGSTSHYSLLTALQDAGLDGQISVINLAPDAILAGWSRGEIDAAWIWEPTQSELLTDGHPVMSSADTAKLGAPTFDMVAGTRQFIADNPEFMNFWTAVEDEGTRMLNEDPESAAVSLSVQLGTTKEDALDLLGGYAYPSAADQAGPDYFGGQLAVDLTGTAQFLADQREIDAVAPDEVYSGMVRPDSIAEVAK